MGASLPSFLAGRKIEDQQQKEGNFVFIANSLVQKSSKNQDIIDLKNKKGKNLKYIMDSFEPVFLKRFT